MIFPQGCINFPDLCLNAVQRDVDIPQNIMLVYSSDDIMLIEPDKQEAASTLEALVRHMFIQRVREKTQWRFGEYATSIKFLDVQCFVACQAIPSKVKDKSFAFPATQHLGSLSASNGYYGYSLVTISLLSKVPLNFLNLKGEGKRENKGGKGKGEKRMGREVDERAMEMIEGETIERKKKKGREWKEIHQKRKKNGRKKILCGEEKKRGNKFWKKRIEGYCRKLRAREREAVSGFLNGGSRSIGVKEYNYFKSF